MEPKESTWMYGRMEGNWRAARRAVSSATRQVRAESGRVIGRRGVRMSATESEDEGEGKGEDESKKGEGETG
jgi:hypothetical protein